MDNLCFVLWLLLWPVAESASKYLDSLTHGREALKQTPRLRLYYGLIYFFLYLGVAWLLYQQPSPF